MESDVLLYFVKYPEPGKVKTRLARAIGHVEAARSYRLLAEANLNILRSVSRPGVSITIAFTPSESGEAMKEWLAADCDYLAQKGEGLGERLANAFDHAFRQGAKRVVAVGSDTLGLRAGLIRKAYERLHHKDVVIGPAKDGGYYLIGLSRYEPIVFHNIPWSTSAVFESTTSVIREQKFSYHILDVLADLDEIESDRCLEENGTWSNIQLRRMERIWNQE